MILRAVTKKHTVDGKKILHHLGCTKKGLDGIKPIFGAS